MENSNFNLPVSIQNGQEEVKTISFGGRIIFGMSMFFCLLLGTLAYLDRWVPFLNHLLK
ncbi:MAG: hypothetical protein WC264_03000 [Candidatus Paceibacterota bacterium]|jgi:hypothetical protein